MRILGAMLLLAGTGCSSGPCGDPALECWAATSECPTQYVRYTGSGKCPPNYWCIDPSEPLAVMQQICPDLSSSVIDLSPTD